MKIDLFFTENMEQFRAFLSALMPYMGIRPVRHDIKSSLCKFYSSNIFDRNVLKVIGLFVVERLIEINIDKCLVKFTDSTLHIPPSYLLEYVKYDHSSIELTADIITDVVRGKNYKEFLQYLKEHKFVISVEQISFDNTNVNTSAQTTDIFAISGDPDGWSVQILNIMSGKLPEGQYSCTRFIATTTTGNFLISYNIIPSKKIKWCAGVIFYYMIVKEGMWLWFGWAKYSERGLKLLDKKYLYSCHVIQPSRSVGLSVSRQDLVRSVEGSLETTYSLSKVNILGESIINYNPIKIDMLRAHFFGAEKNYISIMQQRQSPMWSDWLTTNVVRELFRLLHNPYITKLNFRDKEIMDKATQNLNYIFDDNRVQYPFGYMRVFSQIYPSVRFVLYLDQIPDDKLTTIHRELIDVYNPIRERYDQNKHMALKGVALLNDRLFISDTHYSMYTLQYVIEINSVSGEYVLVEQKNKCERCFKNHNSYKCYREYKCDMCYAAHYPGDFKKHICATCNVAFYSTECLVAHRATYCAAPKWCVKCNKSVEYSDLCRLYGHYH